MRSNVQIFRFNAVYSETRTSELRGTTKALLLDVIYLKDKSVFRDHVWVDPNKLPKDIQAGDRIEFGARIQPYTDPKNLTQKHGLKSLKSVIKVNHAI
ncbi:hypothetical protein [Sulfuricurvum sp.]|uniref:hypothetical protein n=1 Tax=Sulfuricurvum sp. TaxID=2025608 RepID=UPI00260EEEEA|nr:hypothetical protein [Sulfuricurvum sp.]MDD3596995.1 hypothetical protein [Sulfuricurvum sp.]